MEGKTYELVCEPGNVHYTMQSKSLDEVVEAGIAHVKRVHSQDISREEVRKLITEVKEPASK